MLQLQNILSRIKEPKPDGKGGYMAFCPCHNDGSKHGRRSLKVDEKDGKLLLYCFAGCTYEAIIAALGLEKEQVPKMTKSRIIETYDYIDEKNNLLFQVCRYTPKDFRQRRPDGAGGWVWNTKGVARRVIYRLPKVLGALHSRDQVFICEGERDVHALESLGLVATTNPGGAGKWLAEYSMFFNTGTRVVILPDNDQPGRDHAKKIAGQLFKRDVKVRIVELPGLPEKSDISDWLANGGTKEKLLELVEKTPEWNLEIPPEEKDNVPWLQTTKTGGIKFYPGVLARHMINNEKVFYAGESFFAYRNGVYNEVSDDEAAAVGKTYLPDNYCKSAWVSDALNLWKLEILRNNEELNRNPMILNLKNQLLDISRLKEGKIALNDHNPDYLSTIQLSCNYKQNARCPLFFKFITEVLSIENVLLLQEIFGYCLAPLTLAQKAFLFYGPGNSGKSTILAILEYLLGKENISHVGWQDLDDRFKAAFLFGKLANIVADLPARLIEDAGMFKSIVGEDTITVERKFKNPFSFQPYARLCFSCNKLPYSKDQTGAFYRRLIIVPFEYVVPEEKVDKHLKTKLFAEIDGIFLWALEGLKRLMKNDYTFSENASTAAQIEKYKIENSNILGFIADSCVLGMENFVNRQKLYNEYKKWCDENGFKYVSQRNFNQEILTNFPSVFKTRFHLKNLDERIWQGIKLINENSGNSPGTVNTRENDFWNKL